MKKTYLFTQFIFLFILVMTVAFSPASTESTETVVTEHSVSTQNIDSQEKQASLAAFDEMMKVVMHKRCMNCHPSDDFPRQGEDSHLHYFGIERGKDGHGLPAAKCGTCHQTENNDYSGVPGAPHWHLAPRSMGWQGLSKAEVGAAILDKSKNGGRSLEDIIKHMTEDPLVLWVFDPGVNHEGTPREAPPISKEDYIKAVKKWAETGAHLPE